MQTPTGRSSLFNPTVKEIALDLSTVHALGLSGHPPNLAELIQRGFGVRSERGENVAQVDRVLGVSVENLAVGQGGPELAVSCANPTNEQGEPIVGRSAQSW